MISSWSVKAEYNFIDFGTQFVTLPAPSRRRRTLPGPL